MPLAQLPYKAKVTGSTQLPSGDVNLTITVYDGNSNPLSTTSSAFPVQSVSSADISQLTDLMEDVIFNQMLADAGSFAAAVLGVSVSVGG